VTPEGLKAYHEQDPRGTHCGGLGTCSLCGSEDSNRRVVAHLAGHIGEGEGECGGYYKCPTCAAEVSAMKAAKLGPPARPLTREERAGEERKHARRRAKAKAARRARKLQRRRAR
jgi:hypothetical protein